MDGDQGLKVDGAATELDGFSLVLPLPYRVALIVVAAVWAWGANLHYLSLVKIDVPALLSYQRSALQLQLPHYLSAYRLGMILTLTLSTSLALFWLLSHGDTSLVIYYDFIPIVTLLAIAALFFVPLSHKRINLSSYGRYRFLSTLKRISTGYIAKTADGRFGDLLLADVLTSYSKVTADLFVALCMFFTPSESATAAPNRACGGTFLVPLIIAVPHLIRFRQCLIEYLRVQRANRHLGTTDQAGWGGQHLANAAKYASSFPVIFLAALQRNMAQDSASTSPSAPTIYRLWFLSNLINSAYSFWWDVQKDWDLTLLSASRERTSPEHAYGLRRTLIFPDNTLYYGAIALDLVLRFTWTLNMSTRFGHFNRWEGGIFLLESVEVFRRWIWIFFRVETEWVRYIGGGFPEQSDILLGEYGSGRGEEED